MPSVRRQPCNQPPMLPQLPKSPEQMPSDEIVDVPMISNRNPTIRPKRISYIPMVNQVPRRN